MSDTGRLTLLDGFALTVGGRELVVPKAQQRLLALVALRRDTNRNTAVGLLWPEGAEARAMASLRTALWRLQQLHVPTVRVAGDAMSLDPGLRLDVSELTGMAALARQGSAELPPSLLLGPHELLPGWYDDWVLVERERLRQLYLHTVEGFAASCLRAGRHGDALEAAHAAVRADPLRESPYRLVIEVHLAEGNVAEALSTYQNYRALLARELGVAPSPMIRGLIHDTVRAAAV
ncbi:BTAD domain-containing putative transcriptional regulator [Kutzneria buriramensis]|uniref:DNA-binding SARP family transcriptional activator n=1 Tax=Kutzneria buriramensis TaxID=1045776 RepID=A0A3E0H3A2_9PSEU|nr:BTAD domain-containing putative transcriptional regulator [Kutzneria buriramensis]REH37271.1 DNA-binding SARP family transcriptional activator [Kutzneria buriramensis]